ncbi:MAG TPA: 4Fe-4S single cluster domain-containing protein [Vicinamibacteria bacterium]|nr:4Fe-4S single cluster domain-containing protein [Vicinamibacteria bacterium]
MTSRSSEEARVRVGARVPVTRAEGPGARFALWLQGCSLRCAGCCNPRLFEAEGGTRVSVADLLIEVAAVRAQVEGVTLLGGEPFEQAEALAPFASGVRALGLSVLTFSGYRREELHSRRDAGVRALLAATDVLVDGRYEATRPETSRLWAGSTNQRFHYLTSRYSAEIETPRGDDALRTVEVRLGSDGTVAVNGWPAIPVGWASPR